MCSHEKFNCLHLLENAVALVQTSCISYMIGYRSLFQFNDEQSTIFSPNSTHVHKESERETTTATPGPTYADPSEIRPPPLPSPPSPYSQLFYPGPCSPYEQPTPSRTGTINSSFGPPSYSSLSNNSPHSEFAAQLRGVGNPLSDEGVTMRLRSLSSRC